MAFKYLCAVPKQSLGHMSIGGGHWFPTQKVGVKELDFTLPHMMFRKHSSPKVGNCSLL